MFLLTPTKIYKPHLDQIHKWLNIWLFEGVYEKNAEFSTRNLLEQVRGLWSHLPTQWNHFLDTCEMKTHNEEYMEVQ